MTKSELKSKLEKSIAFLQSELSQISTGRASPAMLDSVVVEAYDSKMSVIEVASVVLLDSQTISITPWDKNLIPTVATAIRDSDLNLNPVEDTDRVRVPVPALTEERRQEFAKQASAKVEECKNSLRNIRQDAMKDIDKEFSEKSISEDEKFSQKEAVEEIVKEYNTKAEELGESKKSDILSL